MVGDWFPTKNTSNVLRNQQTSTTQVVRFYSWGCILAQKREACFFVFIYVYGKQICQERRDKSLLVKTSLSTAVYFYREGRMVYVHRAMTAGTVIV